MMTTVQSGSCKAKSGGKSHRLRAEERENPKWTKRERETRRMGRVRSVYVFSEGESEGERVRERV